ncbi:MAG: UvrB/UvrC motif-containing protein [Phycisphaerales bacterium JB043]
MKCDKCDNEATVHEVVLVDGKHVEKHLCEEHAANEGLMPHPHAPITQMLSKFVVSSGEGVESDAPVEDACPSCGQTYAGFRKEGLLGCEHCYEMFESRLGPLLQRTHENATHHVGKVPRRSGGTVDRGTIVATLRKQLLEAIHAEHYEKAAKIRDRLREVGVGGEPDTLDENGAEHYA